MKSKTISLLLCMVLVVPVFTPAHAQNVTPEITVHLNDQGPELSPYLYGLFFEDINFGADGGLYAELVQNRSFEYFPVRGEMNHAGYKLTPMTAWEKVYLDGGEGDIVVTRALPLNKVNRNNLEMNVTGREGYVGVYNTGYDGIPLEQGEKYNFSIYIQREIRGNARNDKHKFIVMLQDDKGRMLDSTTIKDVPSSWAKRSLVLQPSASTQNGRLVVLVQGRSMVQIDMVSLFPQNTYKNRMNGLRKDLVEALVDLDPAFLRFPGGCILHGWGIDNVYRWKETTGDVAQRTPNWNRWGYHQTYGLGFYEYFQLCEDLGATPLPVVPVGVSCTFTHFECTPMDSLDQTVQDALDLVEFANGSTDTKWGKVRADMGHPEPFGLKFVCLGNEEGNTPEFRERIPIFVEAFKKKYPDIKLIGTSGLSPQIPLYNLMDSLGVWASDEHYYEKPEWFIDHQDRFDNWDRNKTKVFVGEYASLGNHLFNAVAEAAFLTGIERNADVVKMSCYAPLFARYGHTQWNRADLIWFNDSIVVKTPNYYVQQLFSRNKGDEYLENEKKNWPGKDLAVSATFDKATGDVILKVVNAAENQQQLSVNLDGKGRVGCRRQIITFDW